MNLTCRLGMHPWKRYPTAKAGVAIYRCDHCQARVRTVNDRKRFKKRYAYAGAALVSLLMWYVIVSLGVTGHTKLLWGAEKIAHKVERVQKKADHGIERRLADAGN